MTTNEGAEASTNAKPPLKISSSAAICCIVRVTDEGRVEVLAFVSVSRVGWSKRTRIQLPSESGKTAADLNLDKPEDPAAVVTRCLETEVFVQGVAFVELLHPIDASSENLESASSELTPIISWCVKADVSASGASLHQKNVFAFVATPRIDLSLRKQVITDSDRGTKRSEELQPPDWVEAGKLVGQMQSCHGPVAHTVAVLQTLRLLSRLETTGRVAQEYERLLSQPEFKDLAGDPTRAAEYVVRRRIKTTPQPK